MGKRSASLLTKTQRQRLRNEFESVDADAKQRDQQLIRQRLHAGVLDFRLLATYPDSQYDLAFNDVSEEELRLALADTYLAVERLRACISMTRTNWYWTLGAVPRQSPHKRTM